MLRGIGGTGSFLARSRPAKALPHRRRIACRKSDAAARRPRLNPNAGTRNRLGRYCSGGNRLCQAGHWSCDDGFRQALHCYTSEPIGQSAMSVPPVGSSEFGSARCGRLLDVCTGCRVPLVIGSQGYQQCNLPGTPDPGSTQLASLAAQPDKTLKPSRVKSSRVFQRKAGVGRSPSSQLV
jgi:hypothetical protein